MGPYEVTKQYKNDVEIRHLSTGKISTVFVSDLKPFRGDFLTAKALALKDADQHLIDCLLAYSGDPFVRTSMQFLVRFADSQELWLTWNKDLQDSSPYEDFVRSIPALAPLISSAQEASAWLKARRRDDIPPAIAGTSVRVDLRSLGAEWYSSLDLPDCHTSTYMVSGVFGALRPQHNKKIDLSFPILDYSLLVDNPFIDLYCLREPPGTLKEVDNALVSSFPKLLSRKAPSLPSLEDFLYLVGKTFYDPEYKKQYLVTRVVQSRSRNIVAYVRPVTEHGRPSKEDKSPYHVRDVVALLPN
jgi:hypothetical protein